MVLFARWSQAESAADALNGKTGQLLGQTRPLVVHFANPRRSPQGPPEPGIAPRKVFVGQVRALWPETPKYGPRSCPLLPWWGSPHGQVTPNPADIRSKQAHIWTSIFTTHNCAGTDSVLAAFSQSARDCCTGPCPAFLSCLLLCRAVYISLSR